MSSYLPQPQRQQTQGHENDSRVVDNSSNHHHFAMNPTMLKPVPGPPLPPPPPPPPAATSTHSSGSSGLLLTKAFSPSYFDPDDWVERLLEDEEESFENVGYPESFTDFVAYERYRTQMERSKYEREQKIEARARAIVKAKADGQAKYHVKAQNKMKSAISEVLFSCL
ncbi:hypothetical protein KI688_009464 [Linnemannia hyalina]|uniref:Uncharacterized protein n=1 Tax=Linnemannia hyalina TaxID=64524 RepID=A0A9P7Y0W9_9FUNG|nr:hypothetical protein KI688_009464 [Linnemannia hyalina]